MNNTVFDVIIVGSGAGGATIARELSRSNKKVLILERGQDVPLKESLIGISTIMDEVSVGKKLKDMRAITTGGTTALYFGVAAPPPIETFKALGIDLSQIYQELPKDLPLTLLPDDYYGSQALRLRESAEESGYSWNKELMLVDKSKCDNGYSYQAKWKAKSFVKDALESGAVIVNKAMVSKVITQDNKAIGVEYKHFKKMTGFDLRKAYAEKVIIAAGALATPDILRNSGLKSIGNKGFYFEPNIALFGFASGLNARDNFTGSMQGDLDQEINLGDANLPKLLYRFLMLGMLKPLRLASFSNSICIGVKINDTKGGEIREDGTFYKELSNEDMAKLKKGEDAAVKILKNAGAKNIIKTPVNVTNAAGIITIGEDLDHNLQTEIENLFVCDRSLLPESFRKPPTVTLVCLGKYLSKQILSSSC